MGSIHMPYPQGNRYVLFAIRSVKTFRYLFPRYLAPPYSWLEVTMGVRASMISAQDTSLMYCVMENVCFRYTSPS